MPGRLVFVLGQVAATKYFDHTSFEPHPGAPRGGRCPRPLDEIPVPYISTTERDPSERTVTLAFLMWTAGQGLVDVPSICVQTAYCGAASSVVMPMTPVVVKAPAIRMAVTSIRTPGTISIVKPLGVISRMVRVCFCLGNAPRRHSVCC